MQEEITATNVAAGGDLLNRTLDANQTINGFTVNDLITCTVQSLNLRSSTAVEKSLTVSEISALVPNFKGVNEDARLWITKLDRVRDAYQVNDKVMRIVAANKLVGHAASWFHSKSEHIVMCWEELRMEILRYFSSRPNKVQLMKVFEARKWNRREQFSIYYYEKLTLGNEAGLSDEEILEYMIDGLSDNNLQVQARMADFKSLDDFLRIMKNITAEEKRNGEHAPKPVESRQQKNQTFKARCYNCGEDGHRMSDCTRPKREKGSCYSCGKMGHTIRECRQRLKNYAKPSSEVPPAMDTHTNLLQGGNRNPFMITFNYELVDSFLSVCKFQLNALLDSGSPISLIKSKYALKELLKPYDQNHNFAGINGSKMEILGTIDLNIYVEKLSKTICLTFFVVPDTVMNVSSILGRDYFDKTDLTLTYKSSNDDDVAEPIFGSNELLFIDCSHENDVKLNVNDTVDIAIKTDLCESYQNHYLNNFVVNPKHNFEMSIHLNNDVPISSKPRRLAFSDKEKLSIILDDYLEKGIIQYSQSEYCSPIVLVRKKNRDEIRLCVDYRMLNAITKRIHFPTPLIEDLIDSLRNKEYFSVLDLLNGFFHVSVSKESQKFTSFITPMGQYEFLKMPFGLTNAPSVFQKFIYHIFEKLIREHKVLIYLDDILVATETINEQLDVLAEVFTVAARNGLRFRLDKCFFLNRQVAYLGYLIDNHGIRPDPENVKVIANYKIPTSSKEVHSFLGLASYFRKFIHNFSIIAKPLYMLIRKNVTFKFGADELIAFETLRSKLSSPEVLAIYSPHLETEVHCDASSIGFGAILTQRQENDSWRPVFYFSKRTTDQESKYHSFELECLAVIYALKRFRVYLIGSKFTIITDCDSFRLTLSKRDVNPRISRWVMFLQDYNYEIKHRPGSRMAHVDALSRISGIFIIEANTFEETLALKQNTDQDIIKIRERLELGESKGFELREGVVYKKGVDNLLFYVPFSMENHVIKAAHDDLGHCGINKTIEYISRVYWFPSIHKKVEDYIRNCLKCILYSPNSGRGEGFLYPIPKGNLPFELIHIDHYGPLEATRRNYKYLLVIIDGFTKFVRLYACKSTQVNEVIKNLTDYFRIYSRPKRLISDRGSCFTSNAFKEFMDDNNIKHTLIATHTPRANGQVERVNRVLTPMLAKLAEQTNRWDEIISEVEFSINNTHHNTINTTPSKLLFGINQHGIVNDLLREHLETLNDDAIDSTELRNRAAASTVKAQQIYEYAYNKKRKCAKKYKVGDVVVIKNVDTSVGQNKKLIPRFKGPYQVAKVLDNDRYVIADLDDFQVTQLPYNSVCTPDQMRLY